MSDEKVLTKEIAEQFLTDIFSVEIGDFQAIEDVAAESLRMHEGDLVLAELTLLSDAGAESLSKHKGCLYLDGLTELSDAQAASLGKHSGDLSLNGLTDLSDAVAEGLARHTGRLSLGGLATLTEKAAITLSNHRPTVARFNLSAAPTLRIGGYNGEGIDTSPAAILHLAEYKGCLSVELNRDSKKDDPDWTEALYALDKRPEKRLFLHLTPEMEEVLEQKDTRDEVLVDVYEHFDWVFEQGSGKSSGETFDELKDLVIATGMRKLWMAPFENDDGLYGQYFLWGDESDVLERLRELPDKVGEILHDAGDNAIQLNCTALSDEEAESLSEHQGPVELNGLTELSDAAAHSLTKLKHSLSVNRDILPDSAAQILRDAYRGHGETK